MGTFCAFPGEDTPFYSMLFSDTGYSAGAASYLQGGYFNILFATPVLAKRGFKQKSFEEANDGFARSFLPALSESRLVRNQENCSDVFLTRTKMRLRLRPSASNLRIPALGIGNVFEKTIVDALPSVRVFLFLYMYIYKEVKK